MDSDSQTVLAVFKPDESFFFFPEELLEVLDKIN